jgi:hypothetical protein
VKLALAFVAIWLVTGAGAVAGSIAGAAAGKSALFAGALVGGVLAAAASAWFTARVGWLRRSAQRNTVLGAIAGFAVAAPIAATNLHTPVIPVLATGLAGLGAVAGAAFTGVSEGSE